MFLNLLLASSINSLSFLNDLAPIPYARPVIMKNIDTITVKLSWKYAFSPNNWSTYVVASLSSKNPDEGNPGINEYI